MAYSSTCATWLGGYLNKDFLEFNQQEQSIDDSDNSAYDLYQEARILIDADKLEDAVVVLEKSSRETPHFKTLEKLGEVLLKLGKAKDAVVPLAAASFLNPQVRAPSLLAEALFCSGEENKAKEVASGVLEKEPNNRQASKVMEMIKKSRQVSD